MSQDVCVCLSWSSSTVKPEMASLSTPRCRAWRTLGKNMTVSPSPSQETGVFSLYLQWGINKITLRGFSEGNFLPCIFQGGQHALLSGDTNHRGADAAVPVRDRVYLQRSHRQRKSINVVHWTRGKIYLYSRAETLVVGTVLTSHRSQITAYNAVICEAFSLWSGSARAVLVTSGDLLRLWWISVSWLFV